MTKGEKVGPIDAHGGVRQKKGMNQTWSESKSPVCRLYAHGVRRVVHKAPPQVPPHCAVRLLLQPNTGRCCPSMQRKQKQELKEMLRHAVNTVIVNSVTRMMSKESQLQVL
jgi:hypothetical protein